MVEPTDATPFPALSPATTAVTAGRPSPGPDRPLNTPITMASTYGATGDLEYGRYGNPTWAAFEEALGALEGGRCLTFSSGLAAVSTVLDLVGQGATVVAPRHAYNGTVMQLADLEARGRLQAELVDITDTDAVVAACDDAALVWLESPTNPALEIADIATIRAAAHEAGAYVVVDNTFATPLLQRPLETEVDLVVHSATKFLAGHSDALLGAIVTRDDQLYDVLKGRRDLVGAIPGPGGIIVAGVGLALVLKTSVWARRRYVLFTRWQPKVFGRRFWPGRWTDLALRRRSTLRKERLRKEREQLLAAEEMSTKN